MNQMNLKLRKYLGISVIFGLVLANAGSSFAQDEGAESTATEVVETSTDDTSDDAKKQELFIKSLKTELEFSKTDYRQLMNSVSDTRAHLETVQEEKLSLSEQLANLDNQILFTGMKLNEVTTEVTEVENQIILLYEEIEIRQIALEYQKKLLGDYINLIYQEENSLLTIDEDGSVDAFKLLLTDGSVGENLRNLEYFSLLNETGQQMAEKLAELSKELTGYQTDLLDKKDVLSKLQTELTKEKEQLELQKQAKEQLLKITMGQEEIYNQLLEQTEKEQEQMLADIKTLGSAVDFFEQKISEEGSGFDPENYKSILDRKAKIVYDFDVDSIDLGTDGFVWPVMPDRGISAYFRDPRYVGTFGVQHSAVDIPEYQGSPLRAAADGVVYKARDNGYGYSYIIISHANNFSTVYGHISNILVETGQIVRKGTIIGLTGGMPGTPGAGYMTTGPHLHFEMLLNGTHVDPLQYLPLNILTQEQMENLPEKYYDDWQNAIFSAAGLERNGF